MVSELTVDAVEMIHDESNEECSIAIDAEQTNDMNFDDCRAATFAATTDSDDGVDNVRTDKDLVHYGYFCDGEACNNQMDFPIVGKRYECLPCMRIKYPHNLCHGCFDKYSLKSTDAALSPNHECVRPLTFSSVNDMKSEHASDGNKSCGVLSRHVFQCIDENECSTEKLVRNTAIITGVNQERIKTKLALYNDFDAVTFVVQALFFYPFVLLVYMLRPKMSTFVGNDDASSLNTIFEAIDDKKTYFEGLPMFQIGICWVLNIFAVILICSYTNPSGIVMTIYWIFVYEVFFIQSVIAQVQFHLAHEQSGAAKFAFRTMTGWSTRSLGEKCSITREDILSFVIYRRSVETFPGGTVKFVFQSPLTSDQNSSNGNLDRSLPMSSIVDPAKVLLAGPRTPVSRSYRAIIFWIAATGLVAFISIVNGISSNPVLLVEAFISSIGDQIIENYEIDDFTINEACHINNESSGINSSSTAGRAFANIVLSNMPFDDDSSLTLNISYFLSNESPITYLRFSLEELWGASFINSTPTSVNLRFMAHHDTIGMMLIFPNVSCGSLANVLYDQNGDYPQDTEKLFKFILAWYDRNTFVLVLFECLILLPSLVAFALQGKHICIAMFHTWDYWDAFNSFTSGDLSESGVWVTDHQAKLNVDFMQVENCHTWFEFRKLLIEITNINMRFAIPFLRITITQFVLSTAAICWFIAKGSAPFPGFPLSICLCLSSMATLVLLYPLHNIWAIQNSHVALISEKYRQAESLPLSDDPQTLIRQLHVARLLHGMKIGLENCDDRVSLLGFEVSYGFLSTLGTIAISGISFLFGRNDIHYYVYTGQ